jgi:branched-chain amino acid transport system ATP-binding protein
LKALTVENLSKRYKGVTALIDISLSVESGERLAIIGPNGAGKTTFINLISGVLRPVTGRISLFGRDITSLPLHQRIRYGLGRSFQVNTLFYELTVLDNVLLSLQGTRLSCLKMLLSSARSEDDLTQAKKLLEPIGLWVKRDIPAGSLSHGEQRQLEICLSMGSGARLLLLDEPSAGLTVAESSILVNIIKSLSKDVTLIFSAHDLELVFSVATRIVIFHYGKLFTEGTPEEIRSHGGVRQIYLGKYGSATASFS